MYKNNFNTNKDGHDIEIICEYDSGFARDLFTENFEVLNYASRGDIAVLFYKGVGGEDSESFTWTIKGSVKNLRKWLNENCDLWHNPAEYNKMNKDELIDVVLEALSQDKYVKLSNMDEFNKYQLSDSGLELVPEGATIERCESRGYSQGDYALIYYTPESVHGVNHRVKFDNLIWDAPIYARVDIDGEEYYYEQDSYDWQREEFITQVEKQSGVGRVHFENLIPDMPDYR